jgi:hypothetical protein
VERLPVLTRVSRRDLPGASFNRADLDAVCPAPGHADGSALHIAVFEAIGGIPYEILYDR